MSGTCPICGKPMTEVYKPFCSRRCADVDLAHWLRGDYTIPGPENEAAEELPPRPQDDT